MHRPKSVHYSDVPRYKDKGYVVVRIASNGYTYMTKPKRG